MKMTLAFLTATTASGTTPTLPETARHENEQIVEWLGDAGRQGGRNDFQTTPSRDVFAFPAFSIGPGVWANVPLPMTAVLLLGSLGILGLANRKRSA